MDFGGNEAFFTKDFYFLKIILNSFLLGFNA